MTKEELQVKIGTIESMIADANTEATKYGEQLADLKKQHADLNKAKLTPLQFDELHDTITDAVGQFDFDDTDNYSLDFHIDYDNRISIESMCFQNADELVREIYNNVSELFAEQSAPEDDNQLNQD